LAETLWARNITLRVLESTTRYGKSAKRIAMQLLKRMVISILILSFLIAALILLGVLPQPRFLVW
jgi:hypothetical protein